MSSLTTQVKVSNFIESSLFSQISTWQKLLKEGNLYEFENQISRCMGDLQNEVSECLAVIAMTLSDSQWLAEPFYCPMDFD